MLKFLFSFVFFCLSQTQVYAETVELEINGHIALADYDRSDDPVAPLVVLGHGTLAHKDMETIELLHGAFLERGYSVLSYSLTYGRDRRVGIYDCAVDVHDLTQQEAVDEIAAWMGWARAQGHEKIALLGHSGGGNQVMRYALGDESLAGLILLAPANQDSFLNGVKSLEEATGYDQLELLRQARELVAAGRGEELMGFEEFLYCQTGKPTAHAILGNYEDDGLYDTVAMLSRYPKPSLVIGGTADDIMPHIDTLFAPAAEDLARVEMIEDADHSFLDFFAEDAADLSSEYLDQP